MSHILENQKENFLIKKLSDLDPDQEGVIMHLNEKSSNIETLMEMGIIPGETVKLVRTAPLGDPLEIQLMGYKLCIRKSEAENIEVKYETKNR